MADPQLRGILASGQFRSESCLKISLSHIRALLADLERGLDHHPQVAGVLIDYLMLYHEYLGVQLSGTSIPEVARIAKLHDILREKPRSLTETHIRLLRLKKSLLGI